MRQKLFAALVTLTLGSAATAAFLATNAVAQAPDPHAPMLLAQNTPPAPNAAPRRTPSARTAPNRPQPTTAERTARRNDMCQNGYARQAGRFAALEVRLNLTAAQQPAFTRWRDARLSAAKARAGECASRPLPPMRQPGAQGSGRGANATPPSPVERLTREETMLQHRLADIQAERPALEALYNSLTPAQRQIMARQNRFGGPRGGMRGRFGPRGMMMGRQGGNMMFQRGPMGRGPGTQDPGIFMGPGMQRRMTPPPPPPAQ